MYIYTYIYIYMCVCVCVCVCKGMEREKDSVRCDTENQDILKSSIQYLLKIHLGSWFENSRVEICPKGKREEKEEEEDTLKSPAPQWGCSPVPSQSHSEDGIARLLWHCLWNRHPIDNWYNRDVSTRQGPKEEKSKSTPEETKQKKEKLGKKKPSNFCSHVDFAYVCLLIHLLVFHSYYYYNYYYYYYYYYYYIFLIHKPPSETHHILPT